MDVEFEDAVRLEVDKSFDAGLDRSIVKAYRKRLQMIRAARDERDFYALKSLHFEKLKGDREGQHSMRLNQQWRLILRLEKRGDGSHPHHRLRITTDMNALTMNEPAEVFPPGEILKDELEARNWSQTEFERSSAGQSA